MENKITEATKRLMEDSRFREAKKDNDTLRLWENYREQALLWRALALIQIPLALVSVAFAFYIWSSREILIEVPAKPEPGFYRVNELTDDLFLSYGEKYINLVATYQPSVAGKQFKTASEMITEPVFSKFQENIMGKELASIKQTQKTQVYFIDPTQTTLERSEEDDLVVMRTIGERERWIGGTKLPTDEVQYELTMKTIPKADKHNDYGIVIVNINMQEQNKMTNTEKESWE